MSWFGKLFTRAPSLPQKTPGELGGPLVGCLSGALRRSPSVPALKELAQTIDPSLEQRVLDTEVFIFHKFLVVQVLVVQAWAGNFPQKVTNSAVAAFYSSLQLVLSQDFEGCLYVSEYIRSLVRADRSAFDALERLWVVRARQYEEPFAIDWEEYLKHPPNHLPWKRLVVSFMSNFGEVSGSLHDVLAATPGATHACICVSMSFGVLLPEVGKIIRSHYGP